MIHLRSILMTGGLLLALAACGDQATPKPQTPEATSAASTSPGDVEAQRGRRRPPPMPAPTPTPVPAPTPAPTPTPTPAPAPTPLSITGTSALPTLISDYRYTDSANGMDQPSVTNMQYRPRQAAAGVELDLFLPAAERGTFAAVGKYAGWDVLLPNLRMVVNSTRADATQFSLRRPARVALVLRGSVTPGWLGDWQAGDSPVSIVQSGRTKAARVFEKTFAAGTVKLPGLGGVDFDNNYLLLLAEQTGQPTATPAVPAGQAPVTPNSACPAWVHDQYVTTAPDGKTYPTWHPQIDPVYWCSFGHEHGSDPSLAGAPMPAYGYTAARHGMSESHQGFKGYAVNTPQGWLYVTQHFGTAGPKRACERMHTLDLALMQGGTLKADLHFMADFGVGMAASGDSVSKITGCAAGQQPADGRSYGARHLNLYPNDGYEPWRTDGSRLNIGLKLNDLSFDTGDPITACANLACTSLITRPDRFGLDHRMLFNGPLTVVASGSASGTFYSDPTGETLVPASDPMATKQFIAPGLNFSFSPSSACYTLDPWRGSMQCDGQLRSTSKNIENGVSAPN